MGSTTVLACKYGAPWWLDDPKERAEDQTTGRAKQNLFYAFCVAACFGVIFHTHQSGDLAFDVTPAEIAVASPLIPAEALLAFRIFAACFWLISVVHQYAQPKGSMGFENLSGSREIWFHHGGAWRWQGLTWWSWGLVGLYFVVSSCVTLGVHTSPGLAAHKQPSAAASLAVLLLGLATDFAFMVTFIVTYVLIPGKLKKRYDVDAFFNIHALLQHNANLLLMVAELLLSGARGERTSGQLPASSAPCLLLRGRGPSLLLAGMHVRFVHFPFGLLFGLGYVIIWHQNIRWRITHTLIYPFLSWQHPHALKVQAVLQLVLFGFFALAWCVAEVLRPQPWGPPAVIALTCSLLWIRKPEVPARP